MRKCPQCRRTRGHKMDCSQRYIEQRKCFGNEHCTALTHIPGCEAMTQKEEV